MRTITVNYTEILCNKNIDMRRLDQKNVGLIYLYFSLRKVIDIAFSCKLIIQFRKSHFGTTCVYVQKIFCYKSVQQIVFTIMTTHQGCFLLCRQNHRQECPILNQLFPKVTLSSEYCLAQRSTCSKSSAVLMMSLNFPDAMETCFLLVGTNLSFELEFGSKIP